MSAPVLHERAEQLLAFSRNLCRVETLLGRNSGERFNVFRILRIQRFETRTHSPLLRALLDPKGDHGQGAKFLQLFLAECGVPDASFEAEGATVREEYYIGPKTEDSGGRIDLFLQDRRGRRLGIENKIDACDQENQVQRYKQFLGKGELLYLTLLEREPSNAATLPLGSVRCITYRHHITAWLEACRRHAATAPLVRETLSQYLRLIQELTQQNEDTSMSKELAHAALNKPDDLRAFFALCNARKEVETQIVAWLNGKLDEIATRQGLERPESLKNFRQRYDGFSFTNAALRANNLKIRFEFENADGGGFTFGFVYKDAERPGAYADELRRLFEEHFGKPETSRTWPACTMWNEYETWNDALLPEIRFGEHFFNELDARLSQLAAIADQLFSESTRTSP
jgi:hypothetical protein